MSQPPTSGGSDPSVPLFHPLSVTSGSDGNTPGGATVPPALLPTPPQSAPPAHVVRTPKVLTTRMSTMSNNTNSSSNTSFPSLDALADAFLQNNNAGGQIKPRPLPTTPSTVSSPEEATMERIRALVCRRAWGDVLSVIHGALHGGGTAAGSNQSNHFAAVYTSLVRCRDVHMLEPVTTLRDHVAECIVLQCQAYIQLRRYEDLYRALSQEWQAFSMTQESPPPSWVPPSVCIATAAAWSYVPSSRPGAGYPAALQRLDVLRQRYADAAAVLLAIEWQTAQIATRHQAWRTALQAYDQVVHQLVAANNNPSQRLIGQCEVWSRQGRIFLQMGAVPAAQTMFERATAAWQQWSRSTHPEDGTWTQWYVPAQVYHVNDGLLAMAHGHYDAAAQAFRRALDLYTTTTGTSTKWCVDGTYQRTQWMLLDGKSAVMIPPPPYRATLYAEITNNLAVAALYACRLHDAIQVLEQLIQLDPTCFLTERTAINLCTLYELSADTAVANRQKRTLQLIAKRFFLHDIGPECFRIGP